MAVKLFFPFFSLKKFTKKTSPFCRSCADLAKQVLCYHRYYHFITTDGVILQCTCLKYSSCTIYSFAANKSDFSINYLQKVIVSLIT